MKKFVFILFFVPLVFSAHAKLNVVATTPDFGAIAREIGGDKIELTTLAKATEDPHFVDAKPSFIMKLNRADVLIEGGAELEAGWLSSLLQGARNSKLDAGKPGRIACSEGISLLEIPAALDRSKGDIHASGNPHYMTDPLNAKIVAKHIADSFSKLEPKSRDVFENNLKKFNDRLDLKYAEWKKMLAPFSGRSVVTFHNSWPYFANRFDVKMDLFLEPKPGIPPSSAHLAAVITKMKAGDVKVIILQPYQNRKTAEAVTGHAAATIVNFPTFPSKPSETYVEWMDGLVKSLAAAFETKK